MLPRENNVSEDTKDLTFVENDSLEDPDTGLELEDGLELNDSLGLEPGLELDVDEELDDVPKLI